MSKDQWNADVERICEEFAAGKLMREEAVGELCSLGLDKHEAHKMLNEAIA